MERAARPPAVLAVYRRTTYRGKAAHDGNERRYLSIVSATASPVPSPAGPARVGLDHLHRGGRRGLHGVASALAMACACPIAALAARRRCARDRWRSTDRWSPKRPPLRPCAAGIRTRRA